MDRRALDRAVQELCDQQEGIVGRPQLLAAGLTRSQAWQRVRTGRWQALEDGVYATFTGAVGDRQRVWAALLAVGPPVAAGHRTGLWLDGLIERPPAVVQLSVPERRTVRSPAGVRVHRRREFERLLRGAAAPPRLRLEANVIDETDRATDVEAVLTLVFTATQGRFTTAGRLRAELARRPRHRWRRLLGEVLAEVASPLERRYLRDVERPHRLPRGIRNRPEPDPAGGSRYTDVRYRRWRTRVELDGRQAHPVTGAFRDWRRDNRHAEAEETVLRYGWHDIATVPCSVARQVGVVLANRGWRGEPARCPWC